VTLQDDCIALVGRGTYFLDGSDQSTLLYQEVSGDMLIETRVEAASEQLGLPAFGLMIRESLDHRSRQAHLTCRLDGPHFTPYLLSRRNWGYLEVLDGVLPQGTAPPTPPALWLRLVRQGSTIVAHVSGDAVSWSELGRTTFEPPLAETLLVGLSVTPTCGGGLDCTEPLQVTFCETRLEGEVVAREPRFRRGDVDASGRISITDAILVYRHLFKGEAAPSCEDAADTNDDGVLNLTDVAVIVGYLFRGASEPVSPGPFECGTDADPTDALRPCEEGCR
jgi:hypothetical protein